MPHMTMTWQQAVFVAVAALAVAVVLRVSTGARVRRAAPAFTEVSIVVGLFALWQLAGSLAVMRTTHALSRSVWIWHTERRLHLPSEVSLQHLVLPHPLLVQAANAYYIYGHFMPLIAVLAWTFLRHRDHYPRLRATVVFVTGASLLIQLVPVAPPRMFPALGFVDTGLRYGQSVYGPMSTGFADQLSALPSVHVAWALIIGVVVVRATTSRWRWLAVAHAVLMSLVVVVTANHFWADGLVAAALVAIALGAAPALRWLRSRPLRVPVPLVISDDRVVRGDYGSGSLE
jgi:hypothetical protein